MLKSIFDDIRQQFDYGNKITQLIIVNAVVFIIINLIRLGFTISAGFEYDARFDDVVDFLSLYSNPLAAFTHPWGFITHMFLHVSFWHVLFNMLFLYWFGRIVGDMIGDKRIIPLYLMSGLFGALLYMLTAPLTGSPSAYGASGAVMGFVVAAGVLAPDYIFRLILIGEVRLKYIVLVVILLDLFAIGGLSNVGGHMAHIGGMIYGGMYIAMLRRGRDLSVPINRLFDSVGGFFSGRKQPVPKTHARSKVFVRHKADLESRQSESRGPDPQDHQDRLDEILDKIKEAGYDSLSAEEKEFLFRASKK